MQARTVAQKYNAPVDFNDPFGLRVINGVPPGSEKFCSLDGKPFYALAGTDFAVVYATAKANGLNPFQINHNVGQYGVYGFQKLNGDFYPAYTDASNYGVGIYMDGAGYSLRMTNVIGSAFWELWSSGKLKNKSDW